MPQQAADFLAKLPRNVPLGANRMPVHGTHCCAPYVVRPPLSMLRCATPPETLKTKRRSGCTSGKWATPMERTPI